MAPPVIAWLTDFGTRDHYVGAMKGAALSIAAEATLVDITHDIPPQDILSGAVELRAACRFFPIGTIFVAVVDPGVGSLRRAIAVSAGDYRFVGPDNGVLSLAVRELSPVNAVELADPRYAAPVVSRTFEGRDRFAPAAAWLARGVPLDELGPPLSTITQVDMPAPIVSDATLTGQVLRVDRFGNAITNISCKTLTDWRRNQPVAIAVGALDIDGVVDTYADAPPGRVCALVSSSGYLEIAVANGSAGSELGLSRGTRVKVRLAMGDSAE